MTIPALILASASPRRLALLQTIQIIPARVLPSDIDETPLKLEKPHLYARRIADAKALKIADLHPEDAVLAADTVVACGARILPKADNEQQARSCLALLAGKRHRVYTAISLRYRNKSYEKTVMTVVQFARLSKAEQEAYIASNEWQGKAGGYAIQGIAERFIIRINGSYSNVVGLPLHETSRLLQQIGIPTW